MLADLPPRPLAVLAATAALAAAGCASGGDRSDVSQSNEGDTAQGRQDQGQDERPQIQSTTPVQPRIEQPERSVTESPGEAESGGTAPAAPADEP